MSGSLLHNLAEIREMQGREPLPDPTRIQGFEAGSAPVPESRPVYSAPLNPPLPPGVEDEFLDGGPPAEEAQVPASPLIPRRRSEQHRLVQPPGMDEQALSSALAGMPVPLLAVLDREATWKGRAVALSESDERAIRAVVLKAIQREVQADLQAAGVRRVRRPKAVLDAATAQPAKRGRPRKVTT